MIDLGGILFGIPCMTLFALIILLTLSSGVFPPLA